MSRKITVDVYSKAGTGALTHNGTLAADSKREWLEQLATIGSTTFETGIGGADDALLVDGRYLRFSITGTPCWWAQLEPRDKFPADPSTRKTGRVIKASGRDALAVLEEGTVFPELGFGVISPSNRHMGWMSKYYDSSGWGNAVELKQQSDTDPTKAWYLAPQDWPDPDAWWVGPTGGDTPPQDPGDFYFVGDFTVGTGDGGEYQDVITADDGFTRYWDAGDPFAQQGAGMWGETQRPPVNWFDEGVHHAAVKLVNFDRPNPSSNVTAMIFSVMKMLGGGLKAGPVVARSSSGTKMLDRPVTEPGMTPGHIMKVFVEENQTAGALAHLHLDFDETVDSAGNAWPKEINQAFQVSSTLADVAAILTAAKVAWFRIDPSTTTLTLQAFQTPGADLSGSVVLELAVNVEAESTQRTKIGPNTLATRTAEGRWVVYEDAGAVAAYGRRFGPLQAGTAASDGTAEDQANAQLADKANPSDVITAIRIRRKVGATPYVDFRCGDTVTAPGYDETGAPFLVTGIHVAEDQDPAGNLIDELDLETP